MTPKARRYIFGPMAGLLCLGVAAMMILGSIKLAMIFGSLALIWSLWAFRNCKLVWSGSLILNPSDWPRSCITGRTHWYCPGDFEGRPRVARPHRFSVQVSRSFVRGGFVGEILPVKEIFVSVSCETSRRDAQAFERSSISFWNPGNGWTTKSLEDRVRNELTAVLKRNSHIFFVTDESEGEKKAAEDLVRQVTGGIVSENCFVIDRVTVAVV